MRPPLLDRWKRRQHGLLQSLLLYHGREDHATVRVLLLACIGTVGMPLYYVIWQHFFPQEYESLPLRMLGILLCAIGLFARQFSRQMLNLYLLVTLSYIFPFFFTFMFLMNHASGVWGESLLIGLVVLFHFDTGLALRAYAIGTVLACAGAVALGAGAALSSREVLQQVPIHWFTIAVLSAAKISREVLAQEKLAGMGAGLATVAHELRTPLTSVDANVRGLLRRISGAHIQDKDDRLTIIDALARIQFEVRHMNHMIDLFLLSATAVRQNLHPVETVSMEAVTEAVLRRYPFASQKQQKSVQLELRRDFQFAGQSELAVVVLLNLMRNALRAVQRAGKGRVRIVIDGGHTPPRLLFIDTGCGVAPQQMSLIFRRFYSHPPHNGAGIGLALCQEIMQAWGASIRCVSRESAYAIFVLEFPAR
ncbi:two-component system, CAI-1 autoinducer sensor kinase/phosphatase CqsS [Duganella sp. CF402]|uniref:sensor histidine kinase n=1 Tax=unclassified Duganella TaxID=2636909 RepID=UPI0008CE1FAA|nr:MULTISPECIES: HAMP domain-containing sensor histidine kinase [unclassified Duganella]RZT08972.1 two-component system CAI-1 autoinducer sensor kinase/phosphatase CqsS [Duganella sp. BK701]SEL75156.1 two-component system, CAI-1 autoinducer sensor kinase/phosphatase CqsS [Duganella sp. CF402]